ncbi:Peptidylprolyl isomerase [Thalictrum thalictroides]|uniref:peptidylprolyl isomerase n=1 Tax=Thalictrum thalictroides TaxID=46969 RepID=A0A7J6UX30_THATH|nr:Peptidylprolyl isomerase [Thalictrum thalictroides]
MSVSAMYSLGGTYYTAPPKITKLKSSNKALLLLLPHIIITKATTISSQSHKLEPQPLHLSRRKSIGIGLCLGLISTVFGSQQPQTVLAEEALKCQFTAAPSGLEFCDKVVGYGPEATQGQLIKAHYVGKLENGTVFDSSYSRGKPLTIRIGVGEVIKGWDQGILGGDGIPPMLAGGKRTLKLPPELGYGVRGAGCKGGSCIIPPNSTLFFDVEFVGKA